MTCPRVAQLLAGLCLGLGFAAPPEARAGDLAADLALVRAAEERRAALFERVSRSVVCIFSDARREGGGSGVIFDPRGYGLTNFHVVADMLSTRRGFGGLNDGRLYPLRVLGIDPGGDVALFRLEGRSEFDVAPLGDSDGLETGQWVAALGNPFVLAEDFSPTITFGVISGLHRYQSGQGNLLEYADCIQVSTSINPGNSGGPLFDMNGRIIGINGRGSFEERGRVNVGLGYAISINQIRRFLPALRSGGVALHGTLGATVRAAGDRVIFDAIQDFSPAERAGIRLGDQLLAVGGRPIRTINEFNNAIAVLPADWPVVLDLIRDDNPLQVSTRLERLPLRGGLIYRPDPDDRQLETAIVAEQLEQTLQPPAQPEAIEWRGSLASSGDPQPVRLLLSLSGDIEIEVGPRRTLLAAEAPAPPAEHADAIWWEFRALAQPLLQRGALRRTATFVGGDEVLGRLVCELERVTNAGARLRWAVDYYDGVLRGASRGDDEQPRRAAWVLSPETIIGPRAWPRNWTRTQDGRVQVLRLESMSSAPSAIAAPPEGTP